MFTPIDVRLFWFLLCFDFLKLYLEKIINIAVVGNVPGRPGRYIVLTNLTIIVETSIIIVSIFGFEKKIENCLFQLLALKKTSKIVRFDNWLLKNIENSFKNI